jgi:hypothetical protein
LTLTLILGGYACAEAQQPVSSFADLWMHVKSGDTVFVTDGSGQQTAGVFTKVSESTLSLVVDGQPREVPAADVREIAKRGDSLLNGTLIGAGIGAVLEGAAFVDCDETTEECIHPAAAAAMGAIVFGGAGALIDHLRKGRTVVFRVKTAAVRLRPDVVIRRGGVSASVVLTGR